MNKSMMLFLGALAATAGCSSESGTGGSGGSGGMGGQGGSARACATDIAEGEVQAFGDPTPGTRTEGIVFDSDGTLYVSAQDLGPGLDQLLDVALDGSNEKVAEAESILGLESDARGILAASIDTGELLLIDPSDGMNEPVADGLGAPNFVVTTPWGTILVSDDSVGTGVIYEVTWDGAVSTWTDEVPTPNGMVFSLDGSTLYVAATFEETGLWRIPVTDGEAGTAEKWIPFANGPAPDGVAIDSEGNVYVALNTAGQIARVDPDGNVDTLAMGLFGPASLAFGQGDFDPCSLYVTSLFSTQMSRVGAGIAGVEK
jgi:DNA-binding beta-propeller fold protein YncE